MVVSGPIHDPAAFKEGRDSQLLLPVADLKAQWKMKGKTSFTLSVKTPNG
jgi:hypothetical protein